MTRDSCGMMWIHTVTLERRRMTGAMETRPTARSTALRILSVPAALLLFADACAAASLDLPPGEYGVSFGNSKRWNGLRVNLTDEDVEWVTGINLTLWKPRKSREATMRGLLVGLYGTGAREAEGLMLGLVGHEVRRFRGITLAGVGLGSPSDGDDSDGRDEAWGASEIRGIAVAGVGMGVGSIHGIAVSGLGIGAGEVRGLVVAGLGMGCENVQGIVVCGLGAGTQDASGVFIAGLGMGAQDMRGVAVAGLGLGVADFEGVALSGLGMGGSDLRGIFACGLGI
ncbi:MAG: hypothetical protein ACE5G2_10230, partial [Candidatus Krumholzibacteriia bacterium]